jgi:hypothetical protein
MKKFLAAAGIAAASISIASLAACSGGHSAPAVTAAPLSTHSAPVEAATTPVKPAPVATRTVTAAPAPVVTQTIPVTAPVAPAAPVAPDAPVAPAAPAAPAQGAGGGGLNYNANTSQAFAENTELAYLAAAGDVASYATVEAYSPVTGQDYAMTCGPSENNEEVCTGGNNAEVEFIV